MQAPVVSARFGSYDSRPASTMGPNLAPKSAADADVEVPALVIAYCHSEPDRVGEVALFPKLHAPMVLGRKAGEDPAEPRVTFHRQRPGELVAMPPLEGETLSRRQLVITARPFGFEVENVGRGELLVNGEPAARHLVPSGGTIQVAGALVLYCTSRPLALAPGELAVLAGPDGLAWRDALEGLTEVVVPRFFCIGGPDLTDESERWSTRAGLEREGALLIRPDRVVAWRSRGSIPDAAARLRGVLGRILEPLG